MKKVLFYGFTLPFLYLLSLLPFFLLYFISDLLYLLTHRVIGYRKKVVRENLRKSFPNKTQHELKTIEIKYYHYMCDLLVEVVKLISISEKSLKKRCVVLNLELYDKFAKEGKSVVSVMGHYGNWEWSSHGFALRMQMPLYAIYKTVKDPLFNKFLMKIRSRFGTRLIEMNDTVREMVKNRKEVNVTAFIADQTPSPSSAYWLQFLNQDTPVFKGTEKIASKFDYPVIFTSSRRVKRGYYEVHNKLLTEFPKELEEGNITEIHTQKLEEEIQRLPHTWLWSHRRWKHISV